MKKQFNPSEWQPKPEKSKTSFSSHLSETSDNKNDIEQLTQLIESAATDITPNYKQWRDLGFALSDELSENGRSFYHRLSRFYPNYTQKETDKQFDKCLKSKGHGITIKTLYHLAKESGLVIERSRNAKPSFLSHKSNKTETPESSISEAEGSLSEVEVQLLPTFPQEIFQKLPKILKEITDKANSADDADLLLLGSIIVFSACLPNVYGIYAGREVFPNLFLFISAQASAGKGRLSLCRKLVEPIHRAFRQLAKAEYEQFQSNLRDYNVDKQTAERPKEPPMRMLFIPANNSATGLFQLLKENEEKGLMFETEGDTLAMTFKSEHGNYSDGFRKAFHHETISYNRRRDREYVELTKPCLSALLSGTPKQITALIPNAENGLFSRFIFYHMNIRPEWKDVFVGSSDQTLDQQFERYGNEFFTLYEHLKNQKEPLKFTFTATQQQQFNTYFSQTQLQYLELCGSDYIGTVRRLGLITFRIGMILTSLRIMENGVIETPLICSNDDFEIALEMIKILIKHAAFVFQLMPMEQLQKTKTNPKMQYLETLPQTFDRQTYLAIAETFAIPPKTAEKQIARFVSSGLLKRIKHNEYQKI